MQVRPTRPPHGNCPFCCASMAGEDLETATPVQVSETGIVWWHNRCRTEFLIWEQRDERSRAKDERLAREFEERQRAEAADAKTDKQRRRFKLIRRAKKFFQYI